MTELNNWFKDVRKRYKIRREQPQLWQFREQGFGYIQIPKVATRSIRAALLGVVGEDPEARPFYEFEKDFSAHLPHRKIREVVDSGLLVFAFVRDPLARLYSAWVNKIVDGEKYNRKNIFSCHGMQYGMPFADFVRRVAELEDFQIDRHLRSQSWFLCDEKGLLPSYVGHLEQFSEDWAGLRQRLHVLGEVSHINKASFQMDHMAAYDHETLALAVRRYSKDFDLFGYQMPTLA